MTVAWDDHPQKHRGHLFLLRPELLKTMSVNEPGGISYPLADVDFDWEFGTLTWDKRNTFLTASFNDADPLWFPTNAMSGYFTHGVAPVFEIDESSNILTLPNTPPGTRPGHINIDDNYQIFIWDDFRPWALPPKLYNSGGTYMIATLKGGISSINSMRGVGHNIGSGGVFGQVDPTNGYLDVDFSLEQVLPRIDAFIGATILNWSNPAYSLTASSDDGVHVIANAKDGNPATYWQSASGTDEWIKVDLGSGTTKVLAYVTIRIYTANSFPATGSIEGSNNDSDWTPVAYLKQSSTIPTGTTYYWDVDADRNVPEYRYYRVNLSTTQGASAFTIAEVNFGVGTYTPYDPDWEVGNATIVTGSSSTADITVRYPPGFYWIKSGDWDSAQYWYLARRPVCVLDSDKWYATYYGCTVTASDSDPGYPVDNVYDDLVNTRWRSSSALPQYIIWEFPSERTFKGFRIHGGPYNGAQNPKTFTMSFKNELIDTFFTASSHVEDLTENTWYEFYFDQPITAKTWRFYIETVYSGSAVSVWEIDFIYARPWGFSQNRFEVQSHTMLPEGQEMVFRVRDDLSDYPPGTLVMYHEDEYYQNTKGSLSAADPTGQDREGLVFVGWIDERRTHVERNEDGTIAYTDLVCYDIAGWARRLPYTSIVFQNVGQVGSTQAWGSGMHGLLPGASIDSALFQVLFEFSTLLELADFYHSETWFLYRFPIREVAQNSIYDAADGLAQTIAHRLTCNKMGQFQVLPDANLQASGDRTSTTQQSIGPTDITSWDYARAYTGRVGRHWGSAVVADESVYDDLASGMTAVFCVAPIEDVWSQGLGQIEHGEQLVVDQDELNTREGQRYVVRSNPEFAYIQLELAHGNDAGIDPARMEPILLTIDDTCKGPDGWTCTDQRCYPVSLTIRRDAEAMTKQVSLIVELEVDGVAAETYIPPT